MVLTAVAAVCLAYFFRPPFFPFGAAGEGDLVSIAIFVTTALIVTALTTRLVRTELQLSENTARLEDAQRIAHIGWWERDLATGGITLSDEACRIFGVMATDEPLAGEQLLKVVHPEDWGKVAEARAAAELPGRSRYEVDYRVVHPDGSIRVVHSEGDVVRDKSGRALQMFGVLQDITRLKEAEEQERRMRQLETDLAHLNRVTTMGELTASIAHEINQPLTGVVSSGNACLRYLADNVSNIEGARRAIERIIRDAMRANEVIKRIRALVTKSPAKKIRLDINEVISETVSLVRAELRGQNISLHTELAKGLALVMGDQIELQQVLLNLIMNAKEAMSAVDDHLLELTIRTEQLAPNEVLASVRDTGPGVDEAELDRMFEAFHTTKPTGMGMGLAISRSIIEAHGGRLWAKPNQPRGAVFQFTVPVWQEEKQ